MTEPKKETVRIALPPQPEQAASAPGVAERDTPRIVLPNRSPVTPVPRLPPKIMPAPATETPPDAPVVLPRRPVMAAPPDASLLQPLPKPPGIDAGATSAGSVAASTNGGPKKETARISVSPRPAPAAAPAAPVTITSKPLARVDAIPRSLCWALVGISSVIFLIQIWNYVVS
jgi:hypothetical protein